MKVFIFLPLILAAFLFENADSNPERFYGLIVDPNAKNTPEELARLDQIYNSVSRGMIPSSFDARDYGWVSSVKNQGFCGSCTSFATGGAMEVCLAKAGAPVSGLDISEQQLLDCVNHGYGADFMCNKGTEGISIYAKYIAGKEINHENMYPYKFGFCDISPTSSECPFGGSYCSEDCTGTICQNKTYWNPGAKIDEAIVDYDCSDTRLMKMITKYGSAIVSAVADEAWYDYKFDDGVMINCGYTGSSPNHAVLAIGWGSESGVPYWLIKNSWGSRAPFLKIQRGTCGIANSCVALSCSPNKSP